MCGGTLLRRFVLAACDGLWKVFAAEEALSFVSAILKVSAAKCVYRVTTKPLATCTSLLIHNTV